MTKTRILITGAAGTIGSALVDRLISEDNIVCAFDNNEDGLFSLDQHYSTHTYKSNLRVFMGDIRDVGRLERAMEGVDEVYHCAALKHVYLSEYNPFDVVKTNIDGVMNIVAAALKQNVRKVIFTSSDKAVNPTSAMGASKLLGERLILAANSQVGDGHTRFACVRFGNVLNSKGSVLRIFQRQKDLKQPLTITSAEMTRYFITMSEAMELCLFASQNMLGGEIFISNMGATDILSLAKAYFNGENFEYQLIGEKVGEKLYEELVTEVELKRTIEFGERYVVLPDLNGIHIPLLKAALEKKYSHCKKLSQIMKSDVDMIDFKELEKLMERIKN